MSAIQQPTPNHQGETFGSGETQAFECEALPAEHPEIQARELARQLLSKSERRTEREQEDIDKTA
jgi:hypothetical protein